MFARHARSFACVITTLSLAALHTAAFADSDRDRERDRSKDRTVTVDCASGDTITKALTRGDDRKSLTILIKGKCTESVVINRSDIKLGAAEPDATISGPDPNTDVIRVTGSRVTIDGITITGGRNGVTGDGAAGMIVQNALIQVTGRTGIVYSSGSSGTVDTVTSTGNPRDGVSIDSASAAVIGSQLTQNGRFGVNLSDSASGRIGIDYRNDPSGNTIKGNGASGINISYSSGAFIAMNDISGNGTNATPGNPRFGIGMNGSSADVIGGNTISGNAGQGINLRASSLSMGDTNFGFTSVNTITGNGSASLGGISAFLGSSMNILNAVIDGNNGYGILLTLRSQAQLAGTTIQNTALAGINTGDGIRLQLGSALLGASPTGLVTNNPGFGVNCTDAESSVAGNASLGVVGNTLGGINCTGF
jgi:parallel beta-helix repeat protein